VPELKFVVSSVIPAGVLLVVDTAATVTGRVPAAVNCQVIVTDFFAVLTV